MLYLILYILLCVYPFKSIVGPGSDTHQPAPAVRVFADEGEDNVAARRGVHREAVHVVQLREFCGKGGELRGRGGCINRDRDVCLRGEVDGRDL